MAPQKILSDLAVEDAHIVSDTFDVSAWWVKGRRRKRTGSCSNKLMFDLGGRIDELGDWWILRASQTKPMVPFLFTTVESLGS